MKFLEKMNTALFAAKNEGKEVVKGAFAFEYVIVLAIMVVAIMAVWNVLISPALQQAGGDIVGDLEGGFVLPEAGFPAP